MSETRIQKPDDRFSDSKPCQLCSRPVIFEFTVESPIWNRVVKARNLPEYLCFWCFDKLATEAGERVPIGVNLNGKSAYSAWCALDLPGAYSSEPASAGIVHGVSCIKVSHEGGEGFLHGDDDDRPYEIDGCSYCGRCHHAL
jgi:hypothetical protein